MDQSFCFLDIEATGLDTEKDEIIEIGIIRTSGIKIEAEISFIIRPSIPIPQFITNLTGISEAMAKEGMDIAEIRDIIETFTHGACIVGHNIQVDMAFLHRVNLLSDFQTIDTFDLSYVLLPSQGQYSLKSLGLALHLPGKNSHRALDDARLTYQLFCHLYQEALIVPNETLNLIIRIGQSINWPAIIFFSLVSEDQIINKKDRGDENRFDLEEKIHERINAIQLFSDSNHPEALENISTLVEKLLNTVGINLLEVENRSDYLVSIYRSAAKWSSDTEKQTLLITQDFQTQKFIQKRLKALSGLGAPLDFSELHQREQYLCPQRLEFWLNQKAGSLEQVRLLAKILIWLQNTQTFLRFELNISNLIEQGIWLQLCWTDNTCIPSQCHFHKQKLCPGFESSERAKSARLIFSTQQDIVTSKYIFAGSQAMVLHDIWNLPQNIIQHQKARYTLPEAIGMLNQISFLISMIENSDFFSKLSRQDNEFSLPSLSSIRDDCIKAKEEITDLYEILCVFLLVQRKRLNYENHHQHIRITRGMRMSKDWVELNESLQNVSQTLREVYKKIGEWVSIGINNDNDHSQLIVRELQHIHNRFVAYFTSFEEFLMAPPSSILCWADVKTNGTEVKLFSFPVNTTDLIKSIFSSQDRCLLVSPALRIADSWEYIINRLNLESPQYSSFEQQPIWKDKVMFYWVNNLPDPDNQAKYRTLLEYAITTICEYIKGNILFIFNSHGFMESVIKKVNGALTKLGTEIIELERENERIDLFDNISNSQKKVVFCTYAQLEKSFLPTNSFPIVVFTRLPIQDLSDPVLMSQLEYFDDPFNDFTLPEAVRSFKYALQFVDHREHKKSSALIMDSRILSKEYGKLFLRDVPVCSVSSGNLLHFIKSASDWMS